MDGQVPDFLHLQNEPEKDKSLHTVSKEKYSK